MTTVPLIQPAVRTAAQWEQIALSQAEELQRQAKRLQELHRDLNAEKAKADQARSLAVAYARKAGVDPDEAELKVHGDWEDRLVDTLDRRVHELDAFHFTVWQIDVLILQELESEGLTPEQVTKVRKYLHAATNTGVRPKVAAVVGHVPEQEQLFADGAA